MKDISKNELPRRKYKYVYRPRVGDVVHVNGIPCSYLFGGKLGTNTKLEIVPKSS